MIMTVIVAVMVGGVLSIVEFDHGDKQLGKDGKLQQSLLHEGRPH